MRERRLKFAGIEINAERRSVAVDGVSVSLTVREFDILYHLASHPARVFTREQIVASLWDDDFDGDASTVTVHVRRIRSKIEVDPACPRHVKTVWGLGYCFEP